MFEVVPAQSAPADMVGTTIVLLGAFNPMLLQPNYLFENDLLSEADAPDLGYQILAPEVAVLLLPWMQLVLEPDKLTAITTLQSPIVEPVRDFVLSFYETLKVRRVTAVGLNFDTHFAVPSERVWHKIGHQLVPKQPFWETVLSQPGTASVTIRGTRDEKSESQVNVKIEPSSRLHPGIYVNVNNHFASETLDSDRLVSIASENLDRSKQHSDAIVAAIKGLGE